MCITHKPIAATLKSITAGLGTLFPNSYLYFAETVRGRYWDHYFADREIVTQGHEVRKRFRNSNQVWLTPNLTSFLQQDVGVNLWDNLFFLDWMTKSCKALFQIN